MAGDVTLTASMRSNLYSLQQTAQLMGTVQQRLATGKKVNSALDNPSNYFTAQSLSNRASDINSLLDGMGQAIQAIKMATQGIEAAQKTIDSMKSVANSALQSASSNASGPRTEVAAKGTLDNQRLMTATDNTQLLTNLKNQTTGASLGINVGDKLTVASGTNAAVTYTVTETSSVKDVSAFIEANGATSSVLVSNGIATVKVGATSLTLAGAVATALGVAVTGALSTAGTASTITVATGATMLADATGSAGVADDTISLTSLADANGTSLGIALGDTLTLKLGDSGQTVTFTVGGDNSSNHRTGYNGGGMTLKDLSTWVRTQGDGGSDDYRLTITSGKLKITNDNGTAALKVDGGLATALGLDGSAASSGGSVESSTAKYNNYQSAAPYVSSSTLLRDITSNNGTFIANGQLQTGDSLVITTATMGQTTIKVTDGMTVGDLLTQMNAIDKNLKFSLNTSGQFVVDNQTSGTVKFETAVTALNGTVSYADSALFTDPADGDSTFAINTPGNAVTSTRFMHAGFAATGTAASGGGVIDANKSAQFDVLRAQLDQLVNDASYQGTNLISGTQNAPLTVTFNEKATGASKLEIKAVDLTTSGLSIKSAAGNELGAWKNADAVREALSTLTNAATTLRNQAANFGYNLSTVQNRQDFANNMISTLKEGADKLTLADMNEEGANMLALQTRSQLGTQSLSLASQANQAVMRLFG